VTNDASCLLLEMAGSVFAVLLLSIGAVRGKACGFYDEHPNVISRDMVPMSDGVKLHTITLSPHPFSSGHQYPVVLDRSPYGMFETELVADIFLPFGFAAVSQDMRGTCKSEGNFSLWHSDEQDGVDTLAWILKQPWSDGRLFVTGASADGIASLQLARAGPPALKAQLVIVASALARRAIFPGGAFRQGLTDGWLKHTVPEQYDALYKEVLEHEGASAWWDGVEIKGDQWKAIDWPSVHWAGWCAHPQNTQPLTTQPLTRTLHWAGWYAHPRHTQPITPTLHWAGWCAQPSARRQAHRAHSPLAPRAARHQSLRT
jgi:putative CocE/NonD family hydrolase